MNCKYCEENAFNTIIEDTMLDTCFLFPNVKICINDLDEIDNSVAIDCRGDSLYIRLGDRSEMACIDHSENFKINYCPMCGRKLGD